MTAAQFVTQLSAVAPSVEDLKKLGLTKAEAISIRDSYHAKPRAGAVPVAGDELVQLVTAYDCSTLDVSSFAFNDKAMATGQYTIVGGLEADLLVVDAATGVVQIRDFAKRDIVVHACASNGAAFLAAMILVEAYRAKALFDEELYESSSKREKVAAAATEQAGGSAYAGFYAMMLGFEEE